MYENKKHHIWCLNNLQTQHRLLSIVYTDYFKPFLIAYSLSYAVYSQIIVDVPFLQEAPEFGVSNKLYYSAGQGGHKIIDFWKQSWLVGWLLWV